ncbi:hypothetical protein GQ43DRAFT_438296 [Delitschia confertaspora ATCC 74209]|uniref:Glutamyl-tRNA synthetase n=1 Tax=Delitschia confertaspora ATCC 74209 TaxID=1513339 RepID=A0A9P4JR39_9PLEO|nr:hypothetical protein GQ43DRAFT_438296 [Delitschia confertaspora ATCC 74209]
MSTPYEKAFSAIDAAHSEDPTKIPLSSDPSLSIPYELHYAQKCTEYLNKRCPNASEPLRLAIRAQHFRRWEVPRSSYPMNKVGYHAWRTGLKKRQAEQVEAICLEVGYDKETAAHVAGLIRKEGLGKGGHEDGNEKEEVQVLEDVACLVFLEDQFEGWEKEAGLDEDKVLGILRRTWAKMSGKGHELALAIEMGERPRELVGKALAG